MTTWQRIQGYVLVSGLVICVILGAMLYIAHNKIVQLEVDNKNISQQLIETTSALAAELERAEVIADINTRLDKQDEKIQTQFVKFTRNLSALKQDSADVRDVLSTVVPRAALSGLCSFNSDSQCGEDTKELNRTNGDPSK